MAYRSLFGDLGIVLGSLWMGCLVWVACSRQQQAQTVAVVDQACVVAMASDELIVRASQAAGVPLESYVRLVCSSLPVVEPLLRTVRATERRPAQ